MILSDEVKTLYVDILLGDYEIIADGKYIRTPHQSLCDLSEPKIKAVFDTALEDVKKLGQIVKEGFTKLANIEIDEPEEIKPDKQPLFIVEDNKEE